MQLRQHLVDFVKVAEIIECRVTPAPIQVVNEGRPLNRTQDRVISPDFDIVQRVTRMLRILLRGRGLDDVPTHTRFESHPFSLYVRTGSAEIIENFRIVVKFHTGITQDVIGISFDQAQTFFIEDIVGCDATMYVRRTHNTGTAFLCA